MEHLLLWLSAKLFVLWFRFLFCGLSRKLSEMKLEGEREREAQQWMKSESVRLYYRVLECEHLDSSRDDD